VLFGVADALKFRGSSSVGEVKFEICRVLDLEMQGFRRTQKELAHRLGTTESCISRVRNRKVDNVTFNQLFRYLAVLNPNFKIMIAPR